MVHLIPQILLLSIFILSIVWSNYYPLLSSERQEGKQLSLIVFDKHLFICFITNNIENYEVSSELYLRVPTFWHTVLS